MKNLLLLVCTSFFFSHLLLSAQTVNVSFDQDHWDMTKAEYTLGEFQGKKGIEFTGVIYLKEVSFLNGTIEVDINFGEERNFPGVGFRMQDPGNYEEFYIRPHQSGNPDANQYTPVFNGTAGWQLYYGEAYATPVQYRFNEWHHLKIVVSGSKADIYLDDMEKPLLAVKELKRKIQAGRLSLRGGRVPVRFANYQYALSEERPAETSELTSKGSMEAVVMNWKVSNVIGDSIWTDRKVLDQGLKDQLIWSTQDTEPEGLINLARYGKRSEGHNTIVARMDIQSSTEQLKKISFGYSDVARVFCNDQLMYSGTNLYRSRDYRYLGTIGYFDALYLPLRKGSNEIWFVISENFGGWGVQAEFENLEGIELK